MGTQITFNDLSENIEEWQALPLSLNGTEVAPLDYNAGKTGWIIYGKNLNKTLLSQFQTQLNMSIVIVSTWEVRQYQVVRFAGVLPKKSPKIAHSLDLDIASINTIPDLKLPGLMVMDLNSMGIHINALHAFLNQQNQQEKAEPAHFQEINGQNANSEIEFVRQLKKSVSALKGIQREQFKVLKENVPITKGFSYLIQELQKRDWKVVLLTNGFYFFINELKERFQLHAIYANELSIDKQGVLTGRLKGELIDAKYKMKTLQALMTELAIPIEQTVAIGDSCSDLLMIKAAGLGVAYHAEGKIAHKATALIQQADLTGLWCILSASLDNHS